jgi:DNA adenine methylase
MKSFFRYPGGKSRIAHQIVKEMGNIQEYREPFFGGGSIGLEVLESLPLGADVWVNDKYPPLASLWKMIIEDPYPLMDRISEYVPTVDDFFRIKQIFLGMPEILSEEERAMMCLVLHQISFSGLGVKAGGPIGGKTQKGTYKVDCRWSPRTLNAKILKAHRLFQRANVTCTAVDYVRLLEDATPQTTVYLDPPYYVRGNDLYQEPFSVQDHEELAVILRGLDCKWFISYDDCPEIRDLYSWAKIIEFKRQYAIKNAKREVVELLIKS